MKKNKIFEIESLLPLLFFLPLIISNINLLLRQFGIITTFITIISFGVGYLLGIFSYFILLRKLSIKVVVIILFFLFILLYSFLTNENAKQALLNDNDTNNILMANLVRLIFLYLPLFILSISFPINTEVLMKRMGFLAFINACLCIFIFAINKVLNRYAIEYMNFAYSGLPSFFFCMYLFAKTNKKIYLLTTILGFFVTLFGGSRGALLSFVAFIFLLLAFGFYKGKKIILIPVLLFAIYLVLNIDLTISFLGTILEKFDANSRLLKMINGAEGGIFHFQDRANVQTPVIDHLNDKLFGYGLYGDRYFCGFTGYAHNVVLEILIDFGWIFGLIIICLIVLYSLKMGYYSIKNKDKELLYIWVSIMSLFFIKYMFSQSFLNTGELLFFVGLLFNKQILKKQTFKNSEEIVKNEII